MYIREALCDLIWAIGIDDRGLDKVMEGTEKWISLGLSPWVSDSLVDETR